MSSAFQDLMELEKSTKKGNCSVKGCGHCLIRKLKRNLGLCSLEKKMAKVGNTAKVYKVMKIK